MEEIKIKVKVTRKLFYDSDNFRGIYAVVVDSDYIEDVTLNDYGNITIKGYMPKLNIGRKYTIVVEEDTKSSYKGSYNLVQIEQSTPETTEEQRNFLNTILTENQVNNIFSFYNNGENVVELIKDNKFNFDKIKGIGEYTYKVIREKVLTNLEASKALSYFSKFGIKYNMVMKLVKDYGSSDMAISVVKENPYRLTEMKGVGFIKADNIARKMGFDMKSPHRIHSCVVYILNENRRNGDTWMKEKEVVNKAVSLLGVPRGIVADIMEQKIKGVVKVNDKYALQSLYDAELYIAESIKEMASNNSNKLFTDNEIYNFLDKYESENNIKLEKEQRQFFIDWNNNNIHVLFGGGGTGKTFLLNILLKLLDTKHISSTLLAPTGRASKVMSSYTNRKAHTIHKRIGYKGKDHWDIVYLDENVVIVDETSMCDVALMDNFFKAILSKFKTKVLFLGDDFQLPSVGAGNFLHDLINNSLVTKTRLVKTFRQKDDGMLEINTNVRNNHKFLNHNDTGKIKFGSDCLFHLVNQEHIQPGYLYYYKQVLKKYKPNDIVILTPTRKGKLGTEYINNEIQKIVNPKSINKKEKSFKTKFKNVTFRVGDLVMNEVNTYDVEIYNPYVDEQEIKTTDIFNGDTGVIEDIDFDNKQFIIEFDEDKIAIPFNSMLKNFVHSWAITNHKSQGSQFKVVISIIDKSATFQLNANLIYTSLSRAREFLIVLGQANTINKGMDKFENMERRSFLKHFLSKGVES